MTFRSKYYLSLLFNLLLTIVLLLAMYIYRDKLYQRFLTNPENVNIVMYGNSIVAQGKWAELLLRSDVANSGLPGRVTHHFLQEIKMQVLDKNPKVCFLMGGINDITVGVEESKIFDNYSKIIEILQKHNIIPVVSATLYEQNDLVSKAKVDRLNEYLALYCETKHVLFINPNIYLSDSLGLKPEYAVDKTHLNEKAYRLWARDIKMALEKLAI